MQKTAKQQILLLVVFNREFIKGLNENSRQGSIKNYFNEIFTSYHKKNIFITQKIDLALLYQSSKTVLN